MIQRMLLVILMVLGPIDLALADDWPQWRGPERTGVSNERGLLQSWPAGGPKLLWTFRDGGAGHSSMAVVGDRLYSMGAQGDKEYAYAIDLNTQKKLWLVEVGPCHHRKDSAPWGYGPQGTPTIDSHFFYGIGSQGNLVCIDTATGKKVWSRSLVKDLGGVEGGYGHSESPLVDGDLVVVTPGGKKGAIAALDKKTGTVKWRCTDCILGASPSSPIAIEVGGVRQYVQIVDRSNAVFGTVVGVRASDGKLLWSFRRAGEINTPIYQNNCIFVSYTHGCLLLKVMPDGDKFKAEKIYARGAIENEHEGVVLVGKHLYGFSAHGYPPGCWMCQEFKTGKIVWQKDNPEREMGKGSVAFADGNLYCYHDGRGDVLLIRATPAGYQEKGAFRIPEISKLTRKSEQIWTHPVVANGKLYLRNQDLIFCYDVRKP